MKEERTKFLTALLAIIFIVLIACYSVSYEQRVVDWAAKNGWTIVEQETCFFDSGPFYYRSKNQHIYKLKLKKGDEIHIAYARVGWGVEVEFYDK